MITVYGLGAFLPQLKGMVRDIRTVWTCEELGLPYKRVVMNAPAREHKKPEYLAVNPFGRVPAIQDGEVTLFESSAICSYLGDKAGKLLPAPGTRERSVYDQWMAFAVATLEPMTVRVVGIDFFVADKSESLMKYRNDALEVCSQLIAVLDKQLEERPYILGEAFSIADIMLTTVLRQIKHTEVPSRYASVNGYLKKNEARPAFLRAYENNG